MAGAKVSDTAHKGTRRLSSSAKLVGSVAWSSQTFRHFQCRLSGYICPKQYQNMRVQAVKNHKISSNTLTPNPRSWMMIFGDVSGIPTTTFPWFLSSWTINPNCWTYPCSIKFAGGCLHSTSNPFQSHWLPQPRSTKFRTQHMGLSKNSGF